MKTVLDIVQPGPGDHWAKLESVLAETDVFLPNEDEAAALTGLDDPMEQAERFADAGARTVVITCGGAGSVLVSGASAIAGRRTTSTTRAEPGPETPLTPVLSPACWPARTWPAVCAGPAPSAPVAFARSAPPRASSIASKPSNSCVSSR